MCKTNFSKRKLFLSVKDFLFILSPYLLFLSIILIVLGYNNSFLFLNKNHLDWLDLPMFFITHVGDSLILSSILVLVFVRKYPEAIVTALLVIIITGIFTQLLKISFFADWDRPLKVFNESPDVYVLQSYKLFHNSFPSGHSLTITAGLTSFIIGIRAGRTMQMLGAITIILTSFSRIYLGVHFPGDVLAGCLMGIGFALLLTPVLIDKFNRVHFSASFRTILTYISICTLLAGVWFLKNYFPT